MILLDGELYQLPVPIEQFVLDGWKVEDKWILPGEKADCIMTKDGKTVEIYAHNIMGDSVSKVGQPAKLIHCEADGVFSQDGVYMRLGRFETGMTEFQMKMVVALNASGKLECVSEREIKQYELVANRMPEGLLKKPEGQNHKRYKLTFYVHDGIVKEIKASY